MAYCGFLRRSLACAVLLAALHVAAAQTATASHVVFYEAKFGIQGVNFSSGIWIDDKRAIEILPGWRAEAILPPGRHVFRAGAKAYAIALDLAPGETYYLRFDWDSSGLVGRKYLTRVDQETAVSQCRRTEPARVSAIKEPQLFVTPECAPAPRGMTTDQ